MSTHVHYSIIYSIRFSSFLNRQLGRAPLLESHARALTRPLALAHLCLSAHTSNPNIYAKAVIPLSILQAHIFMILMLKDFAHNTKQ